MKRIYEELLEDHLRNNRQMAFVTGPRQVGKTTTSRVSDNTLYFNWDNPGDRAVILKGAEAILQSDNLAATVNPGTRIVFDEIHKYNQWKNFLKGFFDSHQNEYPILVTGSARMNIFKRGSDSLMGRYFLYRMHPLSVAELVRTKLPGDSLVSQPVKISNQDLLSLMNYGGFPEPFIKSDRRFYNRWRSLRTEQLFREDMRDLSNIQEIDQLEILARLIEQRVGQLVNYSSLARDIQVSVNTIRQWITTLEQFFFCFRVRPYHTNVPKTLLKQPKIYLWDWSIVEDEGARNENLVASHLLKAVHFWNDAGYGTFDLYFLRDKMKREVDFLVTQNGTPWILAEVKSSDSGGVSASLDYYSSLLQVKHAFQVSISAPYVERDCFEVKNPVKVPALTFLSQLI